MRKKSTKIHSFLDHPDNEWLFGDDISLEIALDLLQNSFESHHSFKVLLPGIGKSKIAIQLYDKGYKNLTLLDIESEAIEYQRNLFTVAYGRVPQTIQIFLGDILTMVPIDDAFHVVIDKSFLDVFLRQGRSKEVWARLLSTLSPNSIYICMSMFHAKWKQYFTRKHHFSLVLHASIPVERYSRTRPSVQRFSNPVAVFIAYRNIPVRTTQQQP